MAGLDIHLGIDESDLHLEYAFDERNPNFTHSREYNHFFIHGVVNVANDMLRARGHVLLNDMFDQLGFPRTALGSLVGWALDFGHSTYIDVRINDYQDVGDTIGLTFNVQGIIFDKIESSHALSIAHYNIQRRT